MKDTLLKLRDEYKLKFTALLVVAEIFEEGDKDVFMKCLKKASGCKLMIEAYDKEIFKFDKVK